MRIELTTALAVLGSLLAVGVLVNAQDTPAPPTVSNCTRARVVGCGCDVQHLTVLDIVRLRRVLAGYPINLDPNNGGP